MLKKIVGLSIVCMIVLCLATGGTWAYMRDAGKSSSNQISAGTLTLRTGIDPTGGENPVYSEGLSQTINITNLKPTHIVKTVEIYLQNYNEYLDGSMMDSIYASWVNMRFTYVKDQEGPVSMSADSLAAVLQVTTLDYNRSEDLKNRLTGGSDGHGDFNNNGYIDLQDLQTATNSPNAQLNWLTGINPGFNATMKVEFTMRLNDRYGNRIANLEAFQGNGIDVTIDFTLAQ